MARYRDLKTNFVAGEFDPLLKGRSDVKHYFNGADLLRNVVVVPQGGARTRPGSRYLWSVPRVPDVDGGGLSNVRLCSFKFSTEQAYLFVFHHKAVTIFRNNAVVATVVTPYSSDELTAELESSGAMISAGISWTQSLDTLVVFHEDYAPRRIRRTGSHTSWALDIYELNNLPQRAYPGGVYVNGVDEEQELVIRGGTSTDWTNGDTFTLILEDEETENIRYDSTAGVMIPRLEQALRGLPNTSALGIVVTFAAANTYKVAFGGDDGDRPWGSMGYRVVSSDNSPAIDIVVTIPGEFPGEPAISDARGWPRCGVFYGGRLYMAGSYSLPNTVWASRAGDQNDFNNKRQSVDYGFEYSTDTDDVPAFLAMYVGRHLQLFSTSGEFYVPVSENEGLTPENFVLRRTTSRGMKPGLQVHEVDGGTLFVQRLGRTLREFIYADAESAYQANSISLLSSHLMRNPVGATMRSSSNTDEADFLFLANADGTMAVFCTLRTQEVNAFTLWNTAGSWIDVKAVLDSVYWATERTVDGQQVRMVELQDDDLSLDCASVGTGVATSGTAAHLGTRTVDVLLDGYVQPQADMVGGLVPFARPSASSWEVGVPWPDAHPDYPGYRWVVRTLAPEQQLQDGTMSGRKRRIVNVDVMLYETTGLIIEGNRIPFQQFGSMLLDQPVQLFTGRKHVKFLAGWSREGKIAMGDTVATKATISQISYQVSV